MRGTAADLNADRKKESRARRFAERWDESFSSIAATIWLLRGDAKMKSMCFWAILRP